MNINRYLDSTYLKTESQSGFTKEQTRDKVLQLVMEAHEKDIFAVMVRPEWVKVSKQYLLEKQSSVKVGTVIGFPEGTYTIAEKLKEAQKAIEDGVDELDFVINYQLFKKKNLEIVKMEFIKCTEFCLRNDKIVKWIVETAALDKYEIASITRNISKWAKMSFKDKISSIFIKSSTGFYITQDGSPNGATEENIAIILENADGLPVKAAGGIKTHKEAVSMIRKGVKRLGTSSAIQLLKIE